MAGVSRSELGITIDAKRGNLRIYRSVIKALNDPQFVRLLIDREAHEAAVQVASKSDRDRIEVPNLNKAFRFQINSKALTESLANVVGWTQDATYQVPGEIVGDIVIYKLDEAVKI